MTKGYYGYFTLTVWTTGYIWSTLSWSVPSGAVAGKYTVVVTGTSGALSHSVNVTVNRGCS